MNGDTVIGDIPSPFQKQATKSQPPPHLKKIHAPDPEEISTSYRAANRVPTLEPKHFVGYRGR
eukprot:98259-Ditylum_brightwellii.AAC.1